MTLTLCTPCGRRECGDIAPLTLNLGTGCRWVVSSKPRYPFNMRLGESQNQCGRFGEGKNLAATRNSSGVQRVAQSVQQVSNPGSHFLFMAQEPIVGQDILIVEASRSHSDTRQLTGLLCTNDQSDAETATWQHTTRTIDRQLCPGEIRTRNPSKRAAADTCHRPRGHWDRLPAHIRALLKVFYIWLRS